MLVLFMDGEKSKERRKKRLKRKPKRNGDEDATRQDKTSEAVDVQAKRLDILNVG